MVWSKKASRYGGLACVIAGMVILILAQFHHLIVNSHLTEAQAFIYYLPFWIAGSILVLIGAFVVRVTEQRLSKK